MRPVPRWTRAALTMCVLLPCAACETILEPWLREIENAKYRRTYQGPYARTVKATFQFQVRVVGTEPAGDPWHLWLALPRDTSTQTVVDDTRLSVAPTHRFTDAEFGNTIAHWDFSAARELALTGEFTLRVNNILTNIDPARVGVYDVNSAEYQLYTRSETMITINDEVRRIAAEVRAGCPAPANPYVLARSAFLWILDHMAYKYPAQGAGVAAVLADTVTHAGRTLYQGDCGGYSCLYNAILRALGIPARMAVGGWSLGEDQWHVWSEILVPGYGWIPVDTSAADVYLYDEGADLNAIGTKYFGAAPFAPHAEFYFGNIDPYRFVLSIGNDIPLEPDVGWELAGDEQAGMYHDGRAGFLQVPIYHPRLEFTGFIRFEELDP